MPGTEKSFLDQDFPVNLAFVELARKDDGRLNQLQEAARAIGINKEKPETVFQRYGIDMRGFAEDIEKMPYLEQCHICEKINHTDDIEAEKVSNSRLFLHLSKNH